MAKLIAVTGNRGRSTLSWFLALRLLAGGKKAIVISTDSEAPAFPLLLPVTKEAAQRSLGHALALPVVSAQGVLQSMTALKEEKNLGVFAYAPGETAKSYPEIQGTALADFFHCIRSAVDYILVDGSAPSNPIDRYALDHAERTLCVTSADLKGLAWRQAHRTKEWIEVLLEESPYNALEDIRHTFPRPIKHVLPYCKSFRALYNGASILEIKPSRQYQRAVEKLAEQLREPAQTQKRGEDSVAQPGA